MPPTDSSQSRPARVDILAAIVPPILLIFAVLGSILGGIATPTEAAAVGAVGALLMSGARLDRHRCVIMIAAGAFILLAMLAGMFPVRLQRDDLSVGSYALGGVYIALAFVGVLGILAALRNVLSQNMIQGAATSTMTMTAVSYTHLRAHET